MRALPPAGVLELEEVLGNYLDTKVQISLGRARGRIAIDFADLADLERIYRLMADPSALTPGGTWNRSHRPVDVRSPG